MKVTDRLFAAAADIWENYYDHPFVKGLRDGTLEREKFRHYIVQDYFYLIDYARVFALGAAKSPDVDSMHAFASMCMAIMDGEMNIHNGYFGKLALTEEELANTPVAVDNAAYTSYMLRVAYEEDAAAICASILACGYSYEVIAKKMIAEYPDCLKDNYYADWILEYASEEYSEVNRILIDLTDKLTQGYMEEQYKHLERIFVDCSRFEKLFWDMGYEMRL